ncbi:hypothetical protein [Streptococcus danieliae]|uniref:hypothetical protein n=1 Tax=Streptococcus danieliae TaxID=747656 RepID=UPI0021C60A7F|nr:hypothetical protein [Streptococcus danieliae]MCU0082477.1 hypothetical protein [Streptococcus danieliae]
MDITENMLTIAMIEQFEKTTGDLVDDTYKERLVQAGYEVAYGYLERRRAFHGNAVITF